MASPRPYWSGQLRLSLVSIPVDLFTATKSAAKIQFNQVHKPSGKRIRYEKVVPGIGPVDPEDILKGFEYEKGHYVLLTDDEIDAVKLETRKTLELSQFVDACEIDPIYFDRPYFVVPQDELAEDAFRVVRDALRKSKKIGLGQLALRGHEYIVAVKPCGNGLLMETLRYEDEIRKAAPFFKDISAKPADKELMELAEQLIERKTAPFDASVFEDHYAEALRDLIERRRKAHGRKVEVEEEETERPRGENVVDLMSALKQSLAKRQSAPPAKSGKKTKRAKPARHRKAG
jgi:DNA end-binding protein Ku